MRRRDASRVARRCNLLVPSSARRTALAGESMCASPAVMLLANAAHFSTTTVAHSTLVFIFITWSLIVVVFSSVAASVLYLSRFEQEAHRSPGSHIRTP